uniref:GT23 domain-containing protein n=1 Tax=Meloidogyne hapla TaxID=6305 RepID=A0A1I8B7R8_MELHA
MTSVKLNKLESTFNIGNGTIAGIHVRRTDKTSEAPYRDLEEYMRWIDIWYNSEENKIKNTKQLKTSNKRKLFIATDEPKNIIEEAEKSWGSQYEFFHNKLNGSYGRESNDPHRHSEESLISILAEIRILAKCRFVVCTFSSNVCEGIILFYPKNFEKVDLNLKVCRLVYELMQAYQGYAGDNVYSLDFVYAELWSEKEMTSISDYKATNKDELEALERDIIMYQGPKFNGFIGGVNKRNNRKGKFPIVLLRDKLKFESFPVFSLN